MMYIKHNFIFNIILFQETELRKHEINIINIFGNFHYHFLFLFLQDYLILANNSLN